MVSYQVNKLRQIKDVYFNYSETSSKAGKVFDSIRNTSFVGI